MLYINCPMCGKKLFEGEAGSNVKVKCGHCEKLFSVKLLIDEVIIKSKDKVFCEVRSERA